MGLLDDVLGGLGTDGMSRLADSLGLDSDKTEAALGTALPMLLGGLQRNAANADGSNSLLAALDRDHDGSVLDDIAGFLGAGGRSDGERIVDHALGARRGPAEEAVSKASGIDRGAASELLALAAPLVMGALGRAKRRGGVDSSGLSELLAGEERNMRSRSEDGMGLIGRLLDADDDGSVLDDIAARGAGLLKLFGR